MPATSPDQWLAAFPEGERETAREVFSTMGPIAFLPSTQAHVEAMVGHLRDGDMAELEAMGITDREALEQGLLGIEAWTAVAGGIPMAMYGISGSDDEGHPWLLTTCWTVPNWIVFARSLREACDRYKIMFPRLSGVTDARYAPAVRLLTWLGFTVDPGDGPVAFRWKRP